MTLLALRLLGGFAAEVRGAPFDAFATDKVRALLAYLALESPQAQRRAHLATLFWPDWDERSALANLRKSLFRLRQALEAAAPGLAGQALEITHHTVAFRAGADLLAFTGHKMCGPTGIGVLWGRYDLLAELPPFLGGGEMIEIVRMEGSTFAPPPARFEAGTPPIIQAVGLGAAVDYLTGVGMDRISAHEHAITRYALDRLQAVEGLRIIGPTEAVDRGSAISFTLTTSDGLDVHPHDLMQFLDSRGVAVRGGHHCARPLHTRLGIQASARASAYLYTTTGEIDQLADALDYTRDFFGGTR